MARVVVIPSHQITEIGREAVERVSSQTRAKRRTARISYACYPKRKCDTSVQGDRKVPMLSLRGDWLREAGFDDGNQIAIRVTKNQLIITKIST